MRALLIGGTGFIGSFLTPELERLGARVAVLTRGRSGSTVPDRLTRIIGDRKRLRDSGSLKNAIGLSLFCTFAKPASSTVSSTSSRFL